MAKALEDREERTAPRLQLLCWLLALLRNNCSFDRTH